MRQAASKASGSRPLIVEPNRFQPDADRLGDREHTGPGERLRQHHIPTTGESEQDRKQRGLSTGDRHDVFDLGRDAEEGEPVDAGRPMVGSALGRVVERELVEVGLGDHLREAPAERLLRRLAGEDC